MKETDRKKAKEILEKEGKVNVRQGRGEAFSGFHEEVASERGAKYEPRTRAADSVSSRRETGATSCPPMCRMLTGPIQLWQFLLELLMNKQCKPFICWTGDGWEFKLIDPDEVARRWGIRKNKPKVDEVIHRRMGKNR